jgi:hypothetical protein
MRVAVLGMKPQYVFVPMMPLFMSPSFQRAAVNPADRADIFLAALHDPKALAAIGQELLLPIKEIKEIIDYKGFAKKILKTYTLGGWNRYEITGNEVWRTWG